ncbi:MAG: hypothetical protein KME30_05525 [Iphinoe sp. HA4291-MV1]|nr:hypothetical protein [Iphinoe sp. HA4291-MV1]
MFATPSIKDKLLALTKPCYIVRIAGKIGVPNEGYLYSGVYKS